MLIKSADDKSKRLALLEDLQKSSLLRVKRTVERLKLTEHQALAEERRKTWQNVTKLINKYLKASSEARTSGAARERVKATAREIVCLTKPNADLSAVAKCCIRFRNVPQLSRLVA
nr:hypothetical protein [uncultured Rhodoferax sp.]